MFPPQSLKRQAQIGGETNMGGTREEEKRRRRKRRWVKEM